MQHRVGTDRNNAYYPNILSPKPVLASVTSLPAKEQLKLLHDFVVRSLRRRLWKAFQEDDKENALRAYQATTSELIQWLQEEDDYRTEVRSAKEKEASMAAELSGKVSSRIVTLEERTHERRFAKAFLMLPFA